MATTVSLNGSVRSKRGKGSARKLRKDARVPGIVYGKTREPMMIDFDEREFGRLVSEHSAGNLIIDLQVEEGRDAVKTLIRDIQIDPITGSVLHVDFNQISLTDTIEVEIPVELVGSAVGVKDFGGILQHPMRTLAIKCLPQAMPDHIEIDVSELEIGDSITVASLDLGEGVEILSDPEQPLAMVVPPTKIEEPVAAEEEAEEGEGEPELVGKEKEGDGEEGDKEKKDKKEESGS